MTLDEKLAKAIAFLKERHRYVLDLRHDRERHQRMMDREPKESPPMKDKIRRIA